MGLDDAGDRSYSDRIAGWNDPYQFNLNSVIDNGSGVSLNNFSGVQLAAALFACTSMWMAFKLKDLATPIKPWGRASFVTTAL